MGMSVSGLAEMMGVQGQTVRLWVRKGKVPYHRTPSNRIFFTDNDIQSILTQYNTSPESWAYYVRESDGSASSVDEQLSRLKDEYGDSPAHVLSDFASGMKEDREGLGELLDLVANHKITDVAITSRDRLARFGYDYLERYLKDHGVTIHCLGGATEKHPEKELMSDFLSLLSSFSGRYYHLRNTRNQRRFLREVKRRIQ